MIFGVSAIACLAGAFIALFGVIICSMSKSQRRKWRDEAYELKQERVAILEKSKEAEQNYWFEFLGRLESAYRAANGLELHRLGYPMLAYNFEVPDGQIALAKELNVDYSPPEPELTAEQRLRLYQIERRLKLIRYA